MLNLLNTFFCCQISRSGVEIQLIAVFWGDSLLKVGYNAILNSSTN